MLIASREMMSLPDETPPAPTQWLGYYVEAINPNATVSMGKVGGNTAPAPSLLYSTDAGITWAPFDNNGGTTITLANEGDRVYFCAGEGGNTAFGSPSTDNDYYRFRFGGGYVAVGGNILSLLSPTEVTDFPATTARDTFKRLFYGQSYLRDASALVFPPSTLEACYKCMFESCSGLTTPPALLPATVLSSNCYAYMFRYDTALTASPTLAATTLAEGCYQEMFRDCRALLAAPHLPATTLAANCYYSMFQGCSSLASVSVAFSAWSGNLVTSFWLYGVAANGTFSCPEALGDNETIARGDSRCPNGWGVKANDRYWGMYFEAVQANSTVAMATHGSPPSISLEYSTDNGTHWSAFTPGTTSIALASVGDRVFFRSGSAGNSAFSNSGPWANYYNFTGSGQLKVAGNLMSLLTQGETADYPQSASDYTFCRLFSGCTALVDAAKLELPNTVKVNSYRDFFNGCTSLATAPALPATTMANGCYQGMFYGCSALTAAPMLPATSLDMYCYGSMFFGCTSLTTAPTLPATTLALYCYGEMFRGCTGLTAAPMLPAKTLTSGCYEYMFYGCSALASIATKQTSFTGCSSWVDGVAASGEFLCNTTALGDGSTITRGTSACPTGWTVAEMPAFWGFYVQATTANSTVKMVNHSGPSLSLEYSTDGDVWDTFSALGSTTVSLTNIGDRVYFRSGSAGNTRTSSNDSFYHNFAFTGGVAVGGNILSLLRQGEITAIPTSDAFTFASLFKGETALTDASALIMPTNITGHGFQYMFQNCSALTAAPHLPATTLADACYAYMFSGCSALTSISTAQDGFYNNVSACYDWVRNVAASGTFTCPAALGTDSTIERATNACPSGWTVVNT